jgi:L-alanine-DL-glutamate epimerase-like enolase superfamily enzyme
VASNDIIDRLEVSAYKIPTDLPESDGTLEWDSTTMVVVEAGSGKSSGIGYTYTHEACETLIRKALFPIVRGKEVTMTRKIWDDMNAAMRNVGRGGIPSAGISAVDIALWDLKAKLLKRSFLTLIGAAREEIPVYGSGGFTSYSKEQLQKQLGDWAREGITMVKMKVGRDPEADLSRVLWARDAIGAEVQLFVDANGAYKRKQALEKAAQFAKLNVRWFEEPVSSDDLQGLRLLRDRAPEHIRIAAGEYNYDIVQARRMLETGAVDVLQADATRCGGITGFMQAATLAEAFQVPFSAHTAPALHSHLCCAARAAIHTEYFHDHSRIEQMFFDGACKPVAGKCKPDTSQTGLGLDFKRIDAARFKI